MTRILRIFIIAALLTARAELLAGQGNIGTIDFDKSVERQIRQIEQLVGGDAPARNQVVAYQWLIELYGHLGRYDDVERCYQRILAFYSNDVGTLNSYARFLMDRRGDLVRAEKTLSDATAWAKAMDLRSIDLGTTHQLRAEVRRRSGDFETSVRLARSALELLSDERSSDALRTMARSLLALERYDEAADAYLRLIALDRGANDEDVNALELFVSKTTRYGSGEIQRTIDDAVAAQRAREVERIELEGGTLVNVTAGDGVPLEATLRRTDGPGAVLFVHETGSRRSVFTPYAQLLFVDEISSLSIDLRGHGGSRADSMRSYDALSEYNRDQLVSDVVSAYQYLQDSVGLDEGHVAIVAEGNACAVVEKALYRGRIAAPVVYLSPTFPDADRELRTAVSFHPDRPALLVCAREDVSALRSIHAFSTVKERESSQTRTYPDAGHGVETLRRSSEALEHVQQWLRETLGRG